MDYSRLRRRNIAMQTKRGGEKMKKSVFRAAVFTALCIVLTLPAWAAKMLVPVGKVVGLSLAEGSVTVVAFDDQLGSGVRDAGLQIGDEIVSIDGKAVDSAADLHRALEQSDGRVQLVLERDGRQHQIAVNPAVTDQGPRLGIYIREGVTGIGTVTYYDPDTGNFGALGHGVSDAHGQLAQMNSGKIYPASVLSVKMGKVGQPGQLKGSVSAVVPIGQLRLNCCSGVFGSCDGFSGEALPVGQAQKGPAKILSNVSGNAVETFSVEIVKVNGEENENGRDLMLCVTDPALLDITGGIVAGMSGSPIIQNGCLVGAVTHVLVNDPTTGYGIQIENMLDAAA